MPYNPCILLFTETTEVECDMTSHEGEVVTIVHNNLESEVYVQGYEAPGSYQRNLTYTVSWDHIAIIKNQTERCEQYFQFTVSRATYERDNSSIYPGFCSQSCIPGRCCTMSKFEGCLTLQIYSNMLETRRAKNIIRAIDYFMIFQ